MANNPIIGTYKGVNIRKCNVVKIKMGIAEFKRMIDESESSGLSIPKVIYYTGKPCTRCENTNVFFLDKLGNEQKVKRGLLSLPEGNGISIVEIAKLKKCKTTSK